MLVVFQRLDTPLYLPGFDHLGETLEHERQLGRLGCVQPAGPCLTVDPRSLSAYVLQAL